MNCKSLKEYDPCGWLNMALLKFTKAILECEPI